MTNTALEATASSCGKRPNYILAFSLRMGVSCPLNDTNCTEYDRYVHYVIIIIIIII